jgi:hypothetical protein
MAQQEAHASTRSFAPGIGPESDRLRMDIDGTWRPSPAVHAEKEKVMRHRSGTQEKESRNRGQRITIAALALTTVSGLATPCFADAAVGTAPESGATVVAESSSAQPPSSDEPAPRQPSSEVLSASDLTDQQLAKEISNPVTDLWQLQFQFNNLQLESSDTPLSEKWVNNLYFQPILPVRLTEKVNLITRPVLTLYNSVPVPTGPSTTDRQTELGDTILAQVFSPAGTEPWIIAAGPTWIFPTAGSDETGQGKWQLGPAVGGGYITDEFLAGALVQQWWSFAGDDDRKNTNQMALLPLFFRFFEGGWSVGYSGQVLADWNAPSGERWTVPLGVSLGKIVKVGILPVQLQLGAQYFVERPTAGPEWNVQLQITPVIPRLIKRTLFH